MLSDDTIHDLVEKNNHTRWDWITWETLGNPVKKYRKGDVERQYGLWRADYVLLCRAGQATVADKHNDVPYGRGWIKIAVLDGFNYNDHKELIATFLPFVQIDKDGKLIEPPLTGESAGKYWVVLPFNYDDNTQLSNAFGRDLNVFKAVNPSRLTATLPRWSTASRSSVVRAGNTIDTTSTDKGDWPCRTEPTKSACIFGGSQQGNHYTEDDKKTRFAEALSSANGSKFYSVKTGVEYVGTEKQPTKILLEANSLDAMRHSGLIHSVQESYNHDALKVRYQLEILCVTVVNTSDKMNPTWDGFQVRHIDTKPDEVWFPATAIPASGKAFAKSWGGTDKWDDFWETSFMKPLGAAKGEMLAFLGLQQQTGNAQNMLIAFKRKREGNEQSIGLIVRDLGDTLLNDHAYEALKEPGFDTQGLFRTAWENEKNSKQGVSLSFGNIGGGLNPKMTRCGSSYMLFFDNFSNGHDLTDHQVKILSRWGIAMNNAFLDYFTENVGYTPEWQKSGSTDKPPDWHKLVETHGLCAYGMSPLKKYKEQLVDVVITMPSMHRQSLIKYLEGRIKADDVGLNLATSCVALHEMLIGGEVEGYLKSDVGKENLRALHNKHRKS